MNLRTPTTVVLLALALVGAGCSDDDDESGAAADTSATTVPAEPTVTTPAETTPSETAPGSPNGERNAAARLDISRDTDSKPQIPKPSGGPPDTLHVDDVVEGRGAETKPGDQVTVHYVGVLFATGEQFDATWDQGQPFPFVLGAQMVIPGWDRGLVGMKEGGRRTLVIPPDLAYGPQGFPPDIGPDEALVFVVDLLEIG